MPTKSGRAEIPGGNKVKTVEKRTAVENLLFIDSQPKLDQKRLIKPSGIKD